MIGRSSLALAAMLAMTANLPTVQVGTRREVDWWGDRREPDSKGRRAEKDAIALAKAEAKRQRKAAKRAAKVGAGRTATLGHNDPGEGLDASAACGQSSREAATSTGLLEGKETT